jgi:hypothetical protein
MDHVKKDSLDLSLAFLFTGHRKREPKSAYAQDDASLSLHPFCSSNQKTITATEMLVV